MTGYARQLAARRTPEEAYTRYRRACVERVAAGLPPHAGMPVDLRRLARAARLNDAREDAALARELLPLTAVSCAVSGFWNEYRPALVRAAEHDPKVAELLLGITPTMPGSDNHTADESWLELLAECGVFDLLAAPLPPAPEAAAFSALAWLGAFARNGTRGWHQRLRRENSFRPRAVKLLELVGRMGPRLVAEQAAGGADLTLCAWPDADIDLIDQCLALGVRVADPTAEFGFDLPSWLVSGSTRDLVAFAADPRFRPVLEQAVEAVAVGSFARPGAADRCGRSPSGSWTAPDCAACCATTSASARC